MRGGDEKQGLMFSYISCEARVPKEHPLRPIRAMVDRALEEMWAELEGMYSKVGRPSIAPERLLRALLLQVFYSIRSERLLMEQLDYNLLFRWFVGLSMDDLVWSHSTFSKNRERFLSSEIAFGFFERVLAQAREADLISDEHFSVDGTLIEAWASLKSVKAKGGPKEPPAGGGRDESVDFRGQRRSNETHASTSDPEARLFRKGGGREAKLSYMGHVLMDNRHGLALSARLTQATGTAEREAAVEMICDLPYRRRVTLAGDKSYDAREFVECLRDLKVTPHLARNDKARRSNIDSRTTRHVGYLLSQRTRKRIEEIFGWAKTVGNLRQVKHRGRALVGWIFTLSMAAYNLIRIRNLLAEAAG